MLEYLLGRDFDREAVGGTLRQQIPNKCTTKNSYFGVSVLDESGSDNDKAEFGKDYDILCVGALWTIDVGCVPLADEYTWVSEV